MLIQLHFFVAFHVANSLHKIFNGIVIREYHLNWEPSLSFNICNFEFKMYDDAPGITRRFVLGQIFHATKNLIINANKSKQIVVEYIYGYHS